MTLISPVFCTEAELVRKFGQVAITNWSDNDEDGIADDGITDDCINQATQELQLRLSQYSATGLATSTLVNRWAVTIAGYFLSTQRGNEPPAWLEAEFQRIMALLAQVQSGETPLPGVALAGDRRPTMSNLTIDQRHHRSTVRVTPANSTDSPTTLSQDQSHDYPTYLP